jgi:hypothetical protein
VDRRGKSESDTVDEQGEIVQKRIEGSPRDEACANTGSCGTADRPTPSGSTRPATAEHAAGPVPLYLVPQTLSATIHRLGGSIREIWIRRTGRNNYAIAVRTREEDAGDE